MISREQRAEYMSAVSSATADMSYTQLGAIFASAIRRSIACEVQLAMSETLASIDTDPGIENFSALADVLARSGCNLPIQF
jgi:hypothetical protein